MTKRDLMYYLLGFVAAYFAKKATKIISDLAAKRRKEKEKKYMKFYWFFKDGRQVCSNCFCEVERSKVYPYCPHCGENMWVTLGKRDKSVWSETGEMKEIEYGGIENDKG